MVLTVSAVHTAAFIAYLSIPSARSSVSARARSRCLIFVKIGMDREKRSDLFLSASSLPLLLFFCSPEKIMVVYNEAREFDRFLASVQRLFAPVNVN